MRGAIGRAKEKWRLFWSLDPGHRFQTRYHSHRRRHETGEASKWGRIFNLVGGPTLIIAGFAFLPTPGPSYIIIVIGLWMLAGEFLPLARFFDRIEMRLRGLGRWIKATWADSSRVARALLVLALVLCVAALGSVLIT
jgi:hypothetical protein